MNRKTFILGFAGALVGGALLADGAAAQDFITRDRDGRWRDGRLPEAGGRLDVRPVPGTGRSAIYDSRGRRVGTVERGPNGPVVRDNRGTRR